MGIQNDKLNLLYEQMYVKIRVLEGIAMKAYSGIGSKKTPQKIKDIMYQLGYKLAQKGYTLRSGGAKGADNAFEMGAFDAEGDMEIYLPYDGYQGRERDGLKYFVPSKEFDNYRKAVTISRKFHPNFENLSKNEKKFIVRDTYQVLGKELNSLSNFIVCWTPDGCTSDRERSEKTGGTGQAITTGSYYSVPIFNLKIKPHLEKIKGYLKD
mgnify:CR=1 FL=1